MPFPGHAEIALPRAFDRHEDGFSWFPWNSNMKDPKLTADVAAAEERLWKGMVDLAGPRRIVVAGFSQGAILSFVMATRHRDRIAGAFPVAGACPDALLPKEKGTAAPLVAYHGDADDIIPIQVDRDTVTVLQKQDNQAQIREYIGVRHTATDQMHVDLFADMQKALQRKS